MIAQDFVCCSARSGRHVLWCRGTARRARTYSHTRRNNQPACVVGALAPYNHGVPLAGVLGCGILQLSRMAMQSQNFDARYACYSKQKTSEGARVL